MAEGADTAQGTAWTPPPYIEVVYRSPHNPALPTVFRSRTGRDHCLLSGDQYKLGAEAVPEVLAISGVQIANVISPNITSAHQLELAKHANELLYSPGSPVAGVVVTHATGTLEETAFFLDLTVPDGKPVVVNCAMRPASALLADGPANLYQAIAAAIHPDSRDRRMLVVANDQIGSTSYMQKTRRNDVDAYKAPDAGHIGGFSSNRPFYYFSTRRLSRTFDVSGLERLPKVVILDGHIETDIRVLDLVVELEDIDGVVISAPPRQTGR